MNVSQYIKQHAEYNYDDIINQVEPNTYILFGEPIAQNRCQHGRVDWDQQRLHRVNATIRLSDLHYNKPLFVGPIKIDMKFYFSMPKKNSPRLKNTFHTAAPEIGRLIKFIEEVAQGIIFSDECTIASITSEKKYDYVPRTEFFIEQIKRN
jgi:Holliday junction resolvase RusA-like endonuclease